MNQLQQLLHDALMETGHVSACCLIRRKDNVIVASSVGLSLYPEQAQALQDVFRNPSQTRVNGVLFGEQRYNCIRSDKFSIYAKCGEDQGLVLIRTPSLVLLSTFGPGMYPSVCVEASEKLADYFKEKGK